MLVIASPVRKDEINNGVTHIRESHPRKPREDGAPFIWKSDANTTTGKAGPVESAVIQ